MDINIELLDKPLSSLTVREFFEIVETQMEEIADTAVKANKLSPDEPGKTDVTDKYVYGITGIAKLFGCSRATANRIKQSGMINKAVQQLGRQIVVNADYAIELAGKSTKTRRNINAI